MRVKRSKLSCKSLIILKKTLHKHKNAQFIDVTPSYTILVKAHSITVTRGHGIARWFRLSVNG